MAHLSTSLDGFNRETLQSTNARNRVIFKRKRIEIWWLTEEKFTAKRQIDLTCIWLDISIGLCKGVHKVEVRAETESCGTGLNSEKCGEGLWTNRVFLEYRVFAQMIPILDLLFIWSSVQSICSANCTFELESTCRDHLRKNPIL